MGRLPICWMAKLRTLIGWQVGGTFNSWMVKGSENNMDENQVKTMVVSILKWSNDLDLRVAFSESSNWMIGLISFMAISQEIIHQWGYYTLWLQFAKESLAHRNRWLAMIYPFEMPSFPFPTWKKKPRGEPVIGEQIGNFPWEIIHLWGYHGNDHTAYK